MKIPNSISHKNYFKCRNIDSDSFINSNGQFTFRLPVHAVTSNMDPQAKILNHVSSGISVHVVYSICTEGMEAVSLPVLKKPRLLLAPGKSSVFFSPLNSNPLVFCMMHFLHNLLLSLVLDNQAWALPLFSFALIRSNMVSDISGVA